MNIVNVLLFVFIYYIVFQLLKKNKKRNENSLNGPFALPIIGNALDLGSDRPHYEMDKLKQKYGSIFRVYFGDLETIIISDYEIVKEMFSKNFDKFSDRVRAPTTKHFSNGYNNLTLSHGENWLEIKDFLTNALKKTKLICFNQLLDDQVTQLIQVFNNYAVANEPFEPRYFIQRFSLNIIFKFCFNQDFSFDGISKKYDNEINQIKSNKNGVGNGERLTMLLELIDIVFEELAVKHMGDFVDILKPFFYLYLKYKSKSIYKIREFVLNEFEQHKQSFDPNSPRDLLDLLIEEYHSGSFEHHDQKSKQENIDKLVGILIDMIMGAVDTTGSSLEWCVLLLANYPEVQDKAYNELKSLNKNRISLSDRSTTTYVNALIKEVLRYKYISPFGIPRSCNQDCYIQGYHIPKNAQILIHYRGIHFNDQFFQNPLEFDPSRFLLNNDSFEQFVPFGIPKRNCPGQSIAVDELYCAISNILINFKISKIGDDQIDETEIFGLTSHPNLFNVKIEKRIN